MSFGLWKYNTVIPGGLLACKTFCDHEKSYFLIVYYQSSTKVLFAKKKKKYETIRSFTTSKLNIMIILSHIH